MFLFPRRRIAPQKPDPMHLLGFMMDFVRPSFMLSVGDARYVCASASAEQAWPLIAARAGRAVHIHLGVPATLTTPSEARWVGRSSRCCSPAFPLSSLSRFTTKNGDGVGFRFPDSTA